MTAKKPADPVMGIPPYRMAQLMEVSGKLMKQLVTGVWSPTYEEILVILEIMKTAVERSRDEGK